MSNSRLLNPQNPNASASETNDYEYGATSGVSERSDSLIWPGTTGSAKRQSSASSIAVSFRDSFRHLGSSTRNSIRESLRYGGRRVSIRDLGGSSTIPNSSFNLIKNLVGAGVLALPSGV
jgi:hypothetical protein